MPTDDKNRRFFIPDRPNAKPHIYHVVDWVKEKQWPSRRKTIKSSELPTVDFMTIEVYPADKPSNITYITIWGPFDDWDFVEGILAYDYGEEGSRVSYAA